jgi:Ca2+-binding RTX toxin-like protein
VSLPGKTITGSVLNDTIEGGDGDDFLFGMEGNDVLIGDEGADQLYGDEGDDKLYGGIGADYLDGGIGNDTLYGGAGSDALSGGYGDDTLLGGAGNDTLFGGEGIDTAVYTGVLANYKIERIGETGIRITDLRIGKDGIDDVYDVEYLKFADGVRSFNDLVAINGTVSNDTLTGTDFGDVFTGGRGNDTINGGLGTDTAVYTGAFANYSIVRTGVTSVRITDLRAGQDGVDVLTDVELVQFSDGMRTFTDLIAINGTAGNDTLTGTAFDDVMTGGLGSDTLKGGNGADQLSGGDGADALFGGVGDDYLFGGAGNDTLNGDAGVDFLTGGDGADSLNGGSDNDTLSGDGANDTLTGGAGDDQIYGGDGSDTAVYSGNRANYLIERTGLNSIRVTDLRVGKDGIDDVSDIEFVKFADGVRSFASLIAINGTTANDTLTGTYFDDVITGGRGNDIIFGGGSSDTAVFSGTFANYTFARIGETAVRVTDLRTGQDGVDDLNEISSLQFADGVRSFASVVAIDGTAGNDTLTGSAFGDVLTGGRGNDALNGGLGTDWAVYSGNLSDYKLERISVATVRITDLRTGQDGIDEVTDIEFLQFADGVRWLGSLVAPGLTLTGTVGNDILTGTIYDDILTGAGGNDTLIGGGGSDTAVFSGNLADYVLERTSVTTVRITDLRAGQDGIDLLTGITSLRFTDGTRAINSLVPRGLTVVGTAGNDTLVGTTESDTLTGLAGNDILNGGGGYGDRLYGGDGDDILSSVAQSGGLGTNVGYYGGAGNDILNANFFDIVDGGSGIDTVNYLQASGSFTATAANFQNIEIVNVSGTNVNFNASAVSNGLTINANASPFSSASINATAFDDTITVESGNVIVSGNGGNDHISGGAGSDALYGGDGNDWLSGGLGGNTLYGGAGNDTFVLTAHAGFDAIGDFVKGEDHIDLSGQGLSFAQAATAASGSGTTVTINGYVIALANIAPADVTADMFTF